MSRETRVNIDLDEDQAGTSTVAGDVQVTGGEVAATADVIDEDVNELDRLPAHAKTNADGSVTLPLLYPRELQIRKDGKIRVDTYAQLVFHRLTGADQRAIAAARDDMMSVVAFARSTRLSQAVMNALFDKMDAADIAAGGQVMNSFFATGPRTGK